MGFETLSVPAVGEGILAGAELLVRSRIPEAGVELLHDATGTLDSPHARRHRAAFRPCTFSGTLAGRYVADPEAMKIYRYVVTPTATGLEVRGAGAQRNVAPWAGASPAAWADVSLSMFHRASDMFSMLH